MKSLLKTKIRGPKVVLFGRILRVGLGALAMLIGLEVGGTSPQPRPHATFVRADVSAWMYEEAPAAALEAGVSADGTLSKVPEYHVLIETVDAHTARVRAFAWRAVDAKLEDLQVETVNGQLKLKPVWGMGWYLSDAEQSELPVCGCAGLVELSVTVPRTAIPLTAAGVTVQDL